MFRLGRHSTRRSDARLRWLLLPLALYRIDASSKVGALLGKAADDDILKIMATTHAKKQGAFKGAATNYLAAQ